MIATGTNAACFWDNDSDTAVPVSRCRSNQELMPNTRYYTLLSRHQAFAVLTFAFQHLQHHGRWLNASALQATAVHPHCCCTVTTPPECLPGICSLLTAQGWSLTPFPGSVNWMDTSRPPQGSPSYHTRTRTRLPLSPCQRPRRCVVLQAPTEGPRLPSRVWRTGWGARRLPPSLLPPSSGWMAARSKTNGSHDMSMFYSFGTAGRAQTVIPSRPMLKLSTSGIARSNLPPFLPPLWGLALLG
jgi:hypothetical protein